MKAAGAPCADLGAAAPAVWEPCLELGGPARFLPETSGPRGRRTSAQGGRSWLEGGGRNPETSHKAVGAGLAGSLCSPRCVHSGPGPLRGWGENGALSRTGGHPEASTCSPRELPGLEAWGAGKRGSEHREGTRLTARPGRSLRAGGFVEGAKVYCGEGPPPKASPTPSAHAKVGLRLRPPPAITLRV